MNKKVNGYVAGSVIIVFIATLAAWMSNEGNNWISVRWLEYRVKRNVDPVQLQGWATNLLAHFTGYHYEDFEGTNVPPGVAKVQSYPAVRMNGPVEVALFADRKGSPFLVVGAPTLPTPTNENIFPWRPGMYFVR